MIHCLYVCLYVKNRFCEEEEIKAHLHDSICNWSLVPLTYVKRVIMAHTCDPSTLEAETRVQSKFEASLCLIVRLCLTHKRAVWLGVFSKRQVLMKLWRCTGFAFVPDPESKQSLLLHISVPPVEGFWSLPASLGDLFCFSFFFAYGWENTQQHTHWNPCCAVCLSLNGHFWKSLEKAE